MRAGSSIRGRPPTFTTRFGWVEARDFSSAIKASGGGRRPRQRPRDPRRRSTGHPNPFNKSLPDRADDFFCLVRAVPSMNRRVRLAHSNGGAGPRNASSALRRAGNNCSQPGLSEPSFGKKERAGLSFRRRLLFTRSLHATTASSSPSLFPSAYGRAVMPVKAGNRSACPASPRFGSSRWIASAFISRA